MFCQINGDASHKWRRYQFREGAKLKRVHNMEALAIFGDGASILEGRYVKRAPLNKRTPTLN